MQTLNFTDSKAVQAKPDFYVSLNLRLDKVLKDWRASVFSYEWLNANGDVKKPEDLNEKDKEKRSTVENNLANGAPLEIPVLGMGIQDHIEIGSGKAVLCTLASMGYETIPVHIPKTHESDFQAFIAELT